MNDTDCDDTEGAINPNTTWYEDPDEDGFGTPDVSLVQCLQPQGYCLDGTDNCPEDYNPEQLDGDEDGIGDVCETCCIPPTVGDLDQSGQPSPFNVDGIDLATMIDGMFISLDWSAICLSEADTDYSGQPEPTTMDIDGIDLSTMIDALFISLTPLGECP